jgi:hypothetical protein
MRYHVAVTTNSRETNNGRKLRWGGTLIFFFGVVLFCFSLLLSIADAPAPQMPDLLQEVCLWGAIVLAVFGFVVGAIGYRRGS